MAQYGGAQLFNSGSSSYGSIGYGSTSYGSTQNDIVLDFNSGGYSPISVAQNTPTGSSIPSVYSPTFPNSPATTGTPAQSILTAPPQVSVNSPIFQPFDPYGIPTGTVSSSSPSILNPTYNGSSGYVVKSGIYSGNFERFMPETYDAMRRFREATRFDYTFLPGGKKPNSFGMNKVDLRMQLGFPCRFIPNTGSDPGFFYVAPGANLVWWDGPAGPPHMSPSGFGAFIDFGVEPKFNEVFSLNAWFRLGVFSDFKNVSSDAFRYQGRVEGTFQIDPNIQITAGLIYLDRQRNKILPTGGVIWTPHDDLILKLVFPNPKISKRLWNSGNAEWWGYVQGDYGGDCWSIKGIGKTDYNDIRIGVGVEFETLSRVGGYFEFGGSFARELYSHGQKWATPPNVLYLKTGFIF